MPPPCPVPSKLGPLQGIMSWSPRPGPGLGPEQVPGLSSCLCQAQGEGTGSRGPAHHGDGLAAGISVVCLSCCSLCLCPSVNKHPPVTHSRRHGQADKPSHTIQKDKIRGGGERKWGREKQTPDGARVSPRPLLEGTQKHSLEIPSSQGNKSSRKNAQPRARAAQPFLTLTPTSGMGIETGPVEGRTPRGGQQGR